MMSGGVSLSWAFPHTQSSSSTLKILCSSSPPPSVLIPRASRDHYPLCSSDLKLKAPLPPPIKFATPAQGSKFPTPRIDFRCYSSTTPGGGAPPPGPGENESRSILDAFFLGKALAEVLNERIESTVGEFLSTVGRLQAEQQKQIQDFQEEVLEKAKRAKEQAARETMEAQGFIPKSSTESISTVANGVPSSTAQSAANASTPTLPRLPSNSGDQSADIESGPTDKDSFRVPNED